MMGKLHDCLIFVTMMNQNRFFFRLCLLVFGILLSVAGSAQDTLPGFSAEIKAKNKILISWTNPFGTKIKQLSIQRSRDSARLYKTIITIPDPTVLQNGFMDQNLPDTNFFYRIYIMMDGGEYIFGPSKRPITVPPVPKAQPVPQRPSKPAQQTPDKTPPPATQEKPTAPVKQPPVQQPVNPKNQEPTLPPPAPEKILIVKKGEEVIAELNERGLQRFRDSIINKTKDTLSLLSRDTLLVRPFQPREVYGVSKYIFVDKAGLIHIELPWFARRKYLVKFFENDLSPLFEIKDVKDPILLLDKANFMRAGWYFFEIYEDGKLLEKNKFFVGRDF